MNRFRRSALLIPLAAALVACDSSRVPGEPPATPIGTPGATATPLASTSPTPSATAGGTDPTPHAGNGTTVVVDIANFAFQPMELRIAVGTEVRFMNSDAAPHTVTAGSDEAPMPERFDSGLLQPGDEFRMVFVEPGRYPYFCERHPPMTGMIIVDP